MRIVYNVILIILTQKGGLIIFPLFFSVKKVGALFAQLKQLQYICRNKVKRDMDKECNYDCTTCRWGKYNDHWDMPFCYNPKECNNFELYEKEETL